MNRANTKASSQGEKEVGQKYSKALTFGHLNDDVLLAIMFR